MGSDRVFIMCKDGHFAPFEPDTDAERALVERASVLGIEFVIQRDFFTMLAYSAEERRVLLSERELPEEYEGPSRIYAFAHEIGHAVRQSNHEYFKSFKAAQRRGTMFFGLLATKDDFALLYREEVMAWRVGVRILRRLGVAIDGRLLRKARKRSLDSYRYGYERAPWARRYRVRLSQVILNNIYY